MRKTFKAWTRKRKSNDQFITTEISASSKKRAKSTILSLGLEVQQGTEIYI
jgi:hypothetical protein